MESTRQKAIARTQVHVKLPSRGDLFLDSSLAILVHSQTKKLVIIHSRSSNLRLHNMPYCSNVGPNVTSHILFQIGQEPCLKRGTT